MQDDDLFASEMSGVTPLKREPRERLVKTEAVDVSQRRQAATQSGARSDNHLSDDGVPPLDAWYVLEFKRPGIQNGVYRKLRLGHYDIEARLDFDIESLSSNMVVADVIPNPPATNLVRDARANGCKVIDGLAMLVSQGVIGVKHWTGFDPDPTIMRSALVKVFS